MTPANSVSGRFVLAESLPRDFGTSTWDPERGVAPMVPFDLVVKDQQHSVNRSSGE